MTTRFNTKTSLDSTDLVFGILRILALLSGFGWLYFAPITAQEKSRLILLLGSFTGYSLLLYAFVLRRPAHVRKLYLVALVLDLVFLFFLIDLTGGLRSHFYLAFYLLAALHAFYYGLWVGLGVAFVSSLLYLAAGWADLSSLPWIDLVFRLGFLFLVAVSSGMISEKGSRDLREIQTLNRELSLEKSRLEQAYVRLRDIQAQMVHSEQLAALGRLAAGVAHEINNPMASITACAEGLQRRSKGIAFDRLKGLEDLPEYLEVIRREVYRCKEIAEKLLTFSRQSDPVSEVVDLNHVIQDVTALVEYEADLEGKRIAKDLEGETPPVRGDRAQLNQLFLNMLLNGLDAIGETGEVRVTTRKVGNTVRITFADDGCGIAEEDLGKIFEPFYTTKPVGEGTGLGLSVCENIVRKHRGTLSVESKPGVGAVFSIVLPANRRTAEPEERL